MAEASKDPEVFLTQVNDAIDDVTDAVNGFIKAMANFVNDHLTEAGGILGTIAGGPLGGILGGLAGHELEKKFDAAQDQVWAAWEDGQKKIRESIGSILGDPLMMSSISSAYRDSVRELGTIETSLKEVNGLLDASWTGRAYGAYSTASGTQTDAVSGMSEMLLNAADLLDDNSLTLVNHWSDQLQNIVDLAGNLAASAGKIGDAGNWASLGAGVAVELIAGVVSDISNVVTTYISYWASLNIGSAGDWDGLTASFGHNGLPNETWPRPSEALSGAMNDPWEAA
ncbi:hypothetical protein [Nocardioides mangrovi]|uniref:WXG100 family type VII secretion target n=1 Tax=Nocardioides mangrovi TaxID=2874580 RepID=A0ABS7U9V5_9ACTN|nr:hypothetical protein [Nocardioides mangrovi]MBZ5737488.1 hypothetical protein [Nocardioides mangrovi]